MPVSRGPTSRAPLGLRPNRPVEPDDVAAFETSLYPQLRRYGTPTPGSVDLDDVLPELEEALADPDAAAVAYLEELPAAPSTR